MLYGNGNGIISSDETESEVTELMAFYGREEQLKKLSKLCLGDKCSFALIYGRRRVGKSELIKQSLLETGCSAIYYECKQTTEKNNVESLSDIIAEKFALPQLGFKDKEAVLDYLFKKAEDSPLVLVLDEYPYLRSAVRGLDSILQTLLDKYREKSKFKLIVCGSFVEIMKSLLLRENPLYGRVDLAIDLKPMDYYDSAKFYANFSNEDKVRLYGVFGGIPYYNKLIDDSLSVEENVRELIASSEARLANEVDMYLRTEIAKITNANEVFEALAKGFSKYSDLLSQSHVSSGPAMIDVLDKLISMEVVAKEAPINDERNKRKTGYYIIDNLSLYYFRYIFRYSSQLSIMHPLTFYNKYIRDDFETIYVPKIFENICKQYLVRQNRSGLMEEPFFKIGKYYYDDPQTRTNGEFDIVTEDDKGYLFYEAKFRNAPLTQEIIDKEIAQVQATGLNCYRYGFFSKSGFAVAPRVKEVFIELTDLYR